ncbi:uncharacterized protein N7477_005201 [Penicillium maclennaniae]|uniref:uncharacterized protein n=1 Tax=Penicillium maclennaniae TaxID=1343394 RepID=UPI00253FA43B|nr:uncharacterized protein N7477_005201 [Penicillium maclennaniae]KAJ5675267.1 hypothetical protein N7477_005201 [Penicillium maclennaniae]
MLTLFAEIRLDIPLPQALATVLPVLPSLILTSHQSAIVFSDTFNTDIKEWRHKLKGGGVRDLQAPPYIPVRVGLDVNDKALDTVSFGPTSTLHNQDKAISPVVPPHPDVFIRRSERLIAKHTLETHKLQVEESSILMAHAVLPAVDKSLPSRPGDPYTPDTWTEAMAYPDKAK